MPTKWLKELPALSHRSGAAFDVTVLDARPGVWGVLREYTNKRTGYPTAYRLRLRLPEYEFAVRQNGSGCILYGRKKAAK